MVCEEKKATFMLHGPCFRFYAPKQCLDIKAMGGVGLEKLECRITKKCTPNVKILSDELQKTKLFLDLLSQAHNTDKYNIQGVDKTVKCACISELAVIVKTRQSNRTIRTK